MHLKIEGIIALVVVMLSVGCGENNLFTPPPDQLTRQPITLEEVAAANPNYNALVQAAPPGTYWPQLVQESYSWLGVLYRYGGTNRSGIDCSWFVYRVYNNSDATYQYHSVAALKDAARCCTKETTNPEPGDILLFRKKIGGFEHMGLYLWSGYFIHATSNPGRVVIDHLDWSPYHEQEFWRKYNPYFVKWLIDFV